MQNKTKAIVYLLIVIVVAITSFVLGKNTASTVTTKTVIQKETVTVQAEVSESLYVSRSFHDSVVTSIQRSRDSAFSVYNRSLKTWRKEIVQADGSRTIEETSESNSSGSSTKVQNNETESNTKKTGSGEVSISKKDSSSSKSTEVVHTETTTKTVYDRGEFILGLTQKISIKDPVQLPSITAGARAKFGMAGVGGYVDVNPFSLGSSQVRLETYLRLGF